MKYILVFNCRVNMCNLVRSFWLKMIQIVLKVDGIIENPSLHNTAM